MAHSTTRHAQPAALAGPTIIVYGADWCVDTRRTLRHLRRLGAKHHYLNIDEDLDALVRAKALGGGERRTPIVDLGLGGEPLVEPANDTLTAAVVEADMLTDEAIREQMAVQNVGDLERLVRLAAGLLLAAAAWRRGGRARRPLTILGAGVALSGLAGWCPLYQAQGVTSLGGPGDRPAESDRRTWLARRDLAAEVSR